MYGDFSSHKVMASSLDNTHSAHNCPQAVGPNVSAEYYSTIVINGEKKRYALQSAEFQWTASRDKKAPQSDQCKEIEGKNRMGKARDLLKKFRDTKGTFHAKMGTIKGRNGMDLTEVKDIKKIWQ